MGLLVRVQLRAPGFLCVAQLVERNTVNVHVDGSTPSLSARHIQLLLSSIGQDTGFSSRQAEFDSL